MKATEQTIQQIERAIRKIAQKFPASDDTSILTDIHLRVSQDSGELLAFNDEDQEINRCVIEQWIDNKDEHFYDHVTILLRNELKRMNKLVDNLGIMKPYSFVLEDDDKEPIAELYIADDDTVIIGGDIMEGLDRDLDNFLEELFS
ncbi:MAG: hypothetical protein IJV36_03850 [Prevotella sp.]|nr:hypothetical protein [Prevotella sp.]